MPRQDLATVSYAVDDRSRRVRRAGLVGRADCHLLAVRTFR